MGRYSNSEKKGEAKRKRKRGRWRKSDTELSFMALPTVVWFLAFSYLPFMGILLAFKEFKHMPGHNFLGSILLSEWVGLDNFRYFFMSDNMLMLLRNTVCYSAVFLILGTVIPVTFALIIQEIHSRWKAKAYQTMMFLPRFLSWVIVAYFTYALLQPDKGLVNQILALFGKEKVMWYSEPAFWPFFLVAMNVWKGTGNGMVIYLAAIAGIDQELYDAASVDGASKFQQAIHVTLPCIRVTIIILFILSVGSLFRSDFGLFYQVTQGLPSALNKVASTFDTYIYLAMYKGSLSMGRQSAASVFQSVTSTVLILATNWIVSKIDDDSRLL